MGLVEFDVLCKVRHIFCEICKDYLFFEEIYLDERFRSDLFIFCYDLEFLKLFDLDAKENKTFF